MMRRLVGAGMDVQHAVRVEEENAANHADLVL